MKKQVSLLFILFFSACASFKAPDIVPNSGIIKICFQGSCFKQLVIQSIRDAKHTIDSALYGLEDEEITNAIVDAKINRNVTVRMVSDYDSEVEAGFQKLLRNKIEVVFGNSSGIMHNKYFLIDGTYLITGSTNLTSSLDTNFNNMVLIRSPELVAVFKTDFEKMFVEKKFGSVKDDVVFCPAGVRNAFSTTGYQLNQYEVFPFFTPYSNCYKSIFTPNPLQIDDPENPGTPLNYSNAIGYVVIQLIKNASKSIDILAFAFTDTVIVDELKKAYARGVKVRVWMDGSQYKSSYANAGARINLLSDTIKELKLCKPPNGGLLHHKVMIFDNNTVILGSMNFSVSAVADNDENFLLIKNAPELAQEFQRDIGRIDQYSDYLSGAAP